MAARPNWPARNPEAVGKSIRTRNVRLFGVGRGSNLGHLAFDFAIHRGYAHGEILSAPNLLDQGFRYVGFEAQDFRVLNFNQWFAGRREIARVRQPARDHAGKWRSHFHIAKHRLCLFDRRVGHAKAGLGSVEFLLCCHLLFQQDGIALQILARLLPGGDRLIQSRLDLLRIDLSDKISFSHRLPKIHGHAGDAPAHFGLDRSPDLRAHRADYFFGDRMRLHLDRLHAHRDNRRELCLRGMRRLVTGGQAESQTGGEGEKNSHYSSALLPTPSLRKIVSAGQNPVKADWTRFNPTNAVNSNHKELTQCARARLMRINVPAKIRIAPSSFLLFCVFMFVDLLVIIDDMSIYAYSQRKNEKPVLLFLCGVRQNFRA